MKKKLIKSIISLSIGVIACSNISVYAVESYDIDEQILNTELNIKGAYLIEKYLLKYLNQLQEFKETYGIEEDEVIDKNYSNIRKIIFDLRKVQTDKVSKESAEQTMQSAITQIKSINKTLKNYLKNKSQQIKEETRLLQEKYIKIIIPFQKKLDSFIIKIRDNSQRDEKITNQEKKVLSYIDALEKDSIKMKTFRNLNFRNPDDLKTYIIGIVQSIKTNTTLIKNSL